LNRRLDDGEAEDPLAAWLNEFPEVREMLAAEFDGQPISQSNMSHWKQGGFEDWKAQQQALTRVDRIMEDADEIEGAKPALLGNRLAVWLMSRLILAAGALGKEEGSEKDWKVLRELSQTVADLRKGDRGTGWLRLEEKRLEIELEDRQRKPEEEFWKWVEKPEIREAICRGFKTHEERLAMVQKAMFGAIDERIRQGKRPRLPGEAPREKPGQPERCG
jgi:hypothetical protein